jgi:hypothetical protein
VFYVEGFERELQMSALRWGLIVVGVLLLLAGIVFALQGATGIGGGSSMDNNPFWIYAGAVIAVIGAAVAIVGLRIRPSKRAN